MNNEVIETEPVYRWNITKRNNGEYFLTGYTLVNDQWSQDGATLRWAYIDAALEHIRKQESGK